MKKIKYLLPLFLVLFIFVGCGKKDNLKDISYSKLTSMMDEKETFFFVVKKDGCSHCEDYIPKVENVLNEYDVVGYVINLTDLSDEDYDKIQEDFGVNGTPTTIFIKNGKEIKMQRFEGSVSEEKIISKLKTNNYIKEK